MRSLTLLLVLLALSAMRRQPGHRQEGNPVRLRSTGAQARRAELRADAAGRRRRLRRAARAHRLRQRSRSEARGGRRSQAPVRIRGAEQLRAERLGVAGRQDRRQSRSADRAEERGGAGRRARARNRTRGGTPRREGTGARHAAASRSSRPRRSVRQSAMSIRMSPACSSRARASARRLVQQKYGRDQELESDQYGMKYMKLAGYDPWGAVTLQETFVRLSQQEGAKKQELARRLVRIASAVDGASRTEQGHGARQLGRGGEVGEEQLCRAHEVAACHASRRTKATIKRSRLRARRTSPAPHARYERCREAVAAGRPLPRAARRNLARAEAAAGCAARTTRKRSI